MPTVPEYPEEDWMARLGRENGSRQRFAAMTDPFRKRDIEGPLPRGESSGGGKLKPSPMPDYLMSPPKVAQPKASTGDIAEKAVSNIYRISDEFTSKWRGMVETGGMKPIDWKEMQNRFVPQASPLAGVRKEQAESLGYNPRMPMYKGGTWAHRQLSDPTEKSSERGIFFAEDPKIAEQYGGAGGPSQYVASPRNPAVIDLRGKHYSRDSMHNILETARDKGHDLVVIKNIRDVGPTDIAKQHQIVVLDPKIVRKPTAMFDPGSHHLHDLLATILATAGTAGAVKTLSPSNE